MARRPPNPHYASIRVDANFLDSDDPGEHEAALSILRLARAREIPLAMPHSVKAEIDHPNTPAAVKQLASDLIFTYDTGMGNRAQLDVAKRIMRGNALSNVHDADATHLYDAIVWQAHYFVTTDRRIHKKAPELAEAFDGLWIVKPSELLHLIETHEPDGG